MKKTICFLIVMGLTVYLLIFPVSAESPDPNDYYREQYDAGHTGDLIDLLPDREREEFDRIGWDPSSPDSGNTLSVQSFFDLLIDWLRNGIKTPLAVMASLLGFLLLSALIENVLPGHKQIKDTAGLAVSVPAALLLLTPCFLLFRNAVTSLQTVSAYLTSAIGIYSGILLAAGRTVTSSLSSATLLAAVQVIRQGSVGLLLPFLGGFLGIGASSALVKDNPLSRCAEAIKTVVTYAMSALTALFSGVLSLQTVLGGASDSMALRVARLVAGSTPFVGAAFSEATSILSGCLTTLRHSAGAVVIIGLSLVLVPLLIQLLLWRLGLFLVGGVAKSFAHQRVFAMTEVIGYAFRMLTAVIFHVWITFLLSFTVLSMTGGGS